MAQSRRPLRETALPRLISLGKLVKTDREAFTLGEEHRGKWIDITYGRPLLREREAFPGSGVECGKVTTRALLCGVQEQCFDKNQDRSSLGDWRQICAAERV